MEILQSKIYGKNDNFNLEEGKSYSDLKSSFIIKQVDDKFGKIYITDSLGYCIKIFDIELNKKIKDLSKNLEEYKTKVTELFESQKESLKTYTDEKIIESNNATSTSLSNLNNSIENIKKKLPKKVIWEDSKIKIKLNDDNFLETEQINIVTENTKIKSFTYDVGVFKITDTNDTVFPVNADLTQIFALKTHNHDTEYVKLNDERLTNARVASDVHSWAKQPNKPTYSWGDILNKPELNYLPLSGGIITPTMFGNHQEGIRINRANNNWSVLTLGTQGNTGVKEEEYALARNANGNFVLRTGIGAGNMKDIIVSNKNLTLFTNIVCADGFEVGSNGNKLKIFGDGSILIKDKTQIILRDNGDIAFGNKPFNDLIYGEFKGIKLWGQSNEGVVLAGGGVKLLSEISLWNKINHSQYGEVLDSNNKNIKTNSIFLEGDNNSKTTMWSHNNLLYIGSKNYNSFTKVFSDGFVKYGKNKTDILLGDGNSSKKFIGGKNYLNHTKPVVYSLAAGGNISIDYSSAEFVRFTVGSPNDNWCSAQSFLSNDFLSSFNGKHFTLSFDVRVVNGTLKAPTVYFQNMGANYYQTLPIDDEITETNKWYRRYIVGYATSSNYNIHFGFSELNGIYDLKNFKVEYGEFPTDFNLDREFKNYDDVYGLDINNINNWKDIPQGIHRVHKTGEGGMMVIFKTASSSSAIKLWSPTYSNHRLYYAWEIDNNRIGSNFRELAYYEDVIRKGFVSDGGTLNQYDHSNSTIFVRNSGNFELSPLENLTSCSFIKVFNGGNITFSCNGKTIITRGDTQFNGDEGSTAVISIFENKCYIRISNV